MPLGKHAHVTVVGPHAGGTFSQWGGPRMGIFTQPPLWLPTQNALNVVPGGHAPASSRGTHSGAGPHWLVDGWTQTCSTPHVTPPQSDGASDVASADRASEPASGCRHAHPRPIVCH